MNERRKLFGGARVVLCLLVGAIPIVACDGDTPTGPARVATLRPTLPPPAATPTPLPGPFATVDVSLLPATSPSGYRHAFTVRIEVRERRGTPIVARYRGVTSSIADYTFPWRESNIYDLNLPAFGAGTLEVLVEHGSDVPCSAGLDVWIQVLSAGSTEDFFRSFNCGTGFWPL